MELKDLIKKYRAIKADPVWIERNKAKILAAYREAFPCQHKDIFFYFKPVFVTIVALFVFVASSGGLVVYAKNSMPGEVLYSLKRLTEKVVYQLASSNQKPVLRAEMVGNRLGEVKVLVEKLGSKNLENLSLKEATFELEKEIIALKKELGSTDKTIVIGDDLAVRDNKKILKAIKQKDLDLNKILAQTKEAIKEKNLTVALDKINEVERILIETENGEESQIMESAKTATEPKETQAVPTEKTKILPVIPTKPTNPDFKVEIKKESEELFQTDLIKE